MAVVVLAGGAVTASAQSIGDLGALLTLIQQQSSKSTMSVGMMLAGIVGQKIGTDQATALMNKYEALLNDRVAAAVIAKKIPAEQGTLITNKIHEVKLFAIGLAAKSPDERIAALKKESSDIDAWITANAIPTDYKIFLTDTDISHMLAEFALLPAPVSNAALAAIGATNVANIVTKTGTPTVPMLAAATMPINLTVPATVTVTLPASPVADLAVDTASATDVVDAAGIARAADIAKEQAAKKEQALLAKKKAALAAKKAAQKKATVIAAAKKKADLAKKAMVKTKKKAVAAKKPKA